MEYPSAPKLSAAEWKALSERVNDRLVELFTGSDAFLGKAGQRFGATSLKPKSIKTKGKVQDVTGILVLADLAGQSSVFLPGVEALIEVPFTGDLTVFSPIQSTFRGAFRCSVLNGGTGDPFAAVVDLPVLDVTADRQEEFRENYASRANGSYYESLVESRGLDDDTPVAYRIAATLLKVRELYFMWVQNSGPDWPRERIDAEIAMHAEKLRELDAIK